MRRLRRTLGIILAAGVMVLASALTGFADEVKPVLTKNMLADTFPFDIRIETDSSDGRLCYAGAGNKFEEGTGITPEAEFSVEQINPDADINNLKIDIVVIYYDNATKKNLTEQICGFDYGQLSPDTNYSVIAEDVKEDLLEKDRLYSGYNQSVMMKLTYKSDDGKKKKTEYFYITTDDNLEAYGR